MNFKPLSDRVVVKRVEPIAITPGGIHLPDNAKERPDQGIVKAVGPGRYTNDGMLVPCQVQEGDVVVFGRFSGSELKIEGETYTILNERDIFGYERDADLSKFA